MTNTVPTMRDTTTPRVKRSFSVIGHSPDVVELRDGVWHSTSHVVTDNSSSGRLFRLISALDGSLTVGELASREQVSEEEVRSLLDHLRGLGVIEDQAGSALDHYLDQHAGLLRTPMPVTARPVRLIGDPALTSQVAELISAGDPGLEVIDATPDPAMEVLDDPDTSWATHGLRLQEQAERFASWANSIVVFAEARPDPVRASLFNRIALKTGTSWLHGTIDGPLLLVGPTIIPGRTACYACFETRVLMNLTDGEGYQRYKNALTRAAVTGGKPPILPAVSALLCSYLALETINLSHTGSTFTAGKVLATYLPTWETTVNEVLQVPACAACAPVSQRDDFELYFDAKAWLDG